MNLKTTNQTKIGENTNMRNFFLKTLAIFSFLICLSSLAKAQCTNYDWVNNSGCDWGIVFQDASNNNIALSVTTATASGSGTVPSSGCFGCNTTPAYIVFTNASGCTFVFNLTTSSITGVSSTCAGRLQTLICGGTPATSSISIVVTTPGIPCTQNVSITIN